MRLLFATVIGILAALFVVAPASAVVTITIRMEAKYLIGAEIRPRVTVAGASGGGSMKYERYANDNCTNPVQGSSSTSIPGNGDYTGPTLQNQVPGQFSLKVSFSGANACQSYLVQRPVTASAQLAKSTFETGERIEPALFLDGTSTQAQGQVEVGRWGAAGCAPNQGVSAGIVPVVGGQPLGTVNLHDGSLGVKSFRANYSGDIRNAQAVSRCRDYTVGAFIRGKVFQDADGSGSPDTAEIGMAGVTITLRRPQGGTTSVTTNDDGAYEFFVIASGQYTLTPTMPTGFDQTTELELSVQMGANSVGNNNFGVVELPSTLLAIPTVAPATTGGPTPESLDQLAHSSESFAVARLIALSLMVIAAFIMLVLIFAARMRRDDDLF
jgi:hypothetical protein